MFRLSRRKKVAWLSFAATIAVSVIIAMAAFIRQQNQTESYAINATTDDGDTIHVDRGGTKIEYDDWRTYRYTIHSGGESFNAYCANPSRDDPEGDWDAIVVTSTSAKFNKIKLMMFINDSTTQAAVTARNNLFGSWPGISSADDRYAWSHAIIGALYANDYSGISSSNRTRIDNAINTLQSYIDNDSDVWAIAKNYQLFRTNGEGHGGCSGDECPQDVVWIEDNSIYGSIKVKKCDADTQQCTPQGSASFKDIKFEVYNASGSKIYNPKTNNFYSNNQKVAEGLTNANGEITFSDLLSGGIKYLVKETASNASYKLTLNNQQEVTLTTSGQTEQETFYNEVVKGKITVNKIDADTGTCTNSDNLSFEGVKFSVTNNSTNPIVYNGNSYAKGAVIDTKTLSGNACSVVFNDLPYGQYIVKETATSAGYARNTNSYTVNIPTDNNVNVSVTVPNQPIRGDVKFVKKDDNGNVMENVIFSISALDDNNNIKETHIVVTNKDGVVNTSSSFALHSNKTNGYDALYDSLEPVTFEGYGVWFGKDKNGNSLPVRDGVGALPYGKYLIQELRCDANMFCTDILNQKITITINQANLVVDLADWINDCVEFSLETTATDAKDGDHYVELGEKVTIVDKIDYCVKANTNFVIKGVLMDKSTGEELLIDGKPVTSEITLKSETECGTIEMPFTFNASDLGGKEIVVFEKLYYNDSMITSHEDIDDEDQTVLIIKMKTYAVNKETNTKTLPVDQDVEIKDTVYYCLKPDIEYTVKSVLMNKKTGSEVLIDDKPVESEVTFTPEKACGEIEMFFKLNTTDLGGVDLVIFESLYEGDKLILEHKDINNSDETVSVEPPAPNTGAYSKPINNTSAESGNYGFIAISVIAGLPVVLYSLNRKRQRVTFNR